MTPTQCPQCNSKELSKNGIIKDRQRFKCKACKYNFTVEKVGRSIDSYYIIKALQLHIEGISYREIERLLGVSHVSVMNWVKKFHVIAPKKPDYRPTYRVLNHQELTEFYADRNNLKSAGMIVTELGDKFMLIKWERFKK